MNGRGASRRACRPHRTALALACVAALGALGWSAPGAAAAAAAAAAGASVEFDSHMLAGGGSDALLARFEHGNTVLPGTYNIDVQVNQAWKARVDVRFAAPAPTAAAVPCITTNLLNLMGLQPAKIAASAAARLVSDTGCVELAELIPGATVSYDQADLRLDVSVPQAYTGQRPRGYVSPSAWDPGVPALLLNYNLNSYHTASHGFSQTSTYLGLNAGLNLGAWHFRQNSTVTWQSGAGGASAQRHWQNIAAYVRRDLPKLRSTLTLGDSYTDGAVFDSFGIRGVQLATDDRMLPDSMRGYAPVVHGVAESNAKVTIMQNGVQIYQTTVAPGPFLINDLNPTGYGGDLVVSVTEADGRSHGFSVPYASVAQLLRPGITRFDLAAGQLRDAYHLGATPGVIQGTAQHGFSNFITGYAGFQVSAGYESALVGAAFNTHFGALAMDLTEAHASIPGFGSHNGQSFRISYSKIIPSTHTSLTVAAYRYSTSGFLSLQNAEYARAYAQRGLDTLQYLANIPLINGVPDVSLLTPAQRAALAGSIYTGDNVFTPTGLLQQRDRFTLSLNQQLGASGGSLYANASVNDYWNRQDRDSQFQLGYSSHFRRVFYSLTLSRGRTGLGGYDNQLFFNASVPLGTRAYSPSLAINANHSNTTGNQEQLMLSGSAGQWHQFTYGATASHADSGSGNAISVNAGYSSPWAIFNASAGKGSGYSQLSFNASGALVAHQGGITFGQPLGETSAVVYVPGAKGAHILNAPGARVDGSGFALVPYLTPYQMDVIQIDPQGLPLGVQLDATSATVAPFAGALVRVNFKSHYGRALIAHLRSADGKLLPFGTEITDANSQTVGIVGQGGLALLRVARKSGELNARWQDAEGHAQACAFSYVVAKADTATRQFQPIRASCGAPADAGSNPGATP